MDVENNITGAHRQHKEGSFNQNASAFIQIFSTVGRVIGSMMLSVVGFTIDENINRITYGITLGLFIISLIVTIIYYQHLRVKAIARILRVRTDRKLKNSEL